MLLRSYYTVYGEHLQLVAEIADEKDLKEVQAELQNYVVTMPHLAFTIEFPYSDE
jgi:hypothetical protein